MAGLLNADVIIVGGGPAGAIAACELVSVGLRVCLVTSPRRPGVPLGESLPPDAGAMLRSLSVETQFILQAHIACHGILSAWGSSELIAREFIFHPEGCGWHLDREAFDVLLLEAAEAAGAEVLRDARARVPEIGSDRVRLQCEWKGRALSLDARVFVDASGRAALVARAAGVRRVTSDRLVAVTSLLTSPASSDEDSHSLVEAVPNGWWYSALLAKGRVAIFFTDADLPVLAVARSNSGWLGELRRTRHMRELIEQHAYRIEVGPRVVVANSARLSAFFGRSWLAAGDAAVSYDPLSGHGIGAAMKCGKSVATALASSLAGDTDARARYSAQLERSCRDYHSNLRRYYAAEGRWPASAFWRRRQD